MCCVCLTRAKYLCALDLVLVRWDTLEIYEIKAVCEICFSELEKAYVYFLRIIINTYFVKYFVFGQQNIRFLYV